MEYTLKDLEGVLRRTLIQLEILITQCEISSKNIEDLNLEELRSLKQVTTDKLLKKEISIRITNKLIGDGIDGIY